MPVNPDLLEILVCPETKQPVKEAPADVLARVNQEIAAGRLRNRGGAKLEQALAEALVRQDGKVLYPVDDGIPVMLIEESVSLESG